MWQCDAASCPCAPRRVRATYRFGQGGAVGAEPAAPVETPPFLAAGEGLRVASQRGAGPDAEELTLFFSAGEGTRVARLLSSLDCPRRRAPSTPPSPWTGCWPAAWGRPSWPALSRCRAVPPRPALCLRGRRNSSRARSCRRPDIAHYTYQLHCPMCAMFWLSSCVRRRAAFRRWRLLERRPLAQRLARRASCQRIVCDRRVRDMVSA